jgi:hypothetical protein
MRHPTACATPSTQAACTELPDPYQPKEEGGQLDFELRLFNALRNECEQEGLGVRTCDKSVCNELLLRVRDALWMTAGREVEFKCSHVRHHLYTAKFGCAHTASHF